MELVMQNIIKAIISTAALGALTLPANAEYYEHGSIKDAPALAHNWTGFYVGAHVGYGWGTADSNISNTAGTRNEPTTSDPDGFIAGGQAGFNYQTGRLVFGIEGDIAATDLDEQISYPGFNVGGADTDVHTELEWLATIRGRIGFTAGNFLVYGTGGVAFGEFNASFDTVNPAINGKFSETLTGYTVGGGLEYALSQRTSVKVEYQYIDLGDEKIPVTAGFFRSGIELETVKLGVNYRF